MEEIEQKKIRLLETLVEKLSGANIKCIFNNEQLSKVKFYSGEKPVALLVISAEPELKVFGKNKNSRPLEVRGKELLFV